MVIEVIKYCKYSVLLWNTPHYEVGCEWSFMLTLKVKYVVFMPLVEFCAISCFQTGFQNITDLSTLPYLTLFRQKGSSGWQSALNIWGQIYSLTTVFRPSFAVHFALPFAMILWSLFITKIKSLQLLQTLTAQFKSWRGSRPLRYAATRNRAKPVTQVSPQFLISSLPPQQLFHSLSVAFIKVSFKPNRSHWELGLRDNETKASDFFIDSWIVWLLVLFMSI